MPSQISQSVSADALKYRAMSAIREESKHFSVAAFDVIKKKLRKDMDIYYKSVKNIKKISEKDVKNLSLLINNVQKEFEGAIYIDSYFKESRLLKNKCFSENFMTTVCQLEDKNFIIPRYYHYYDRHKTVTMRTYAHAVLSYHAAQRFYERAQVSDNPVRRLATEVMDNFGLFALGARFWSLFNSARDANGPNIVLPTSNGLMLCDMDKINVSSQGIMVNEYRYMRKELFLDRPSPFLLDLGLVKAPLRHQNSLMFNVMTYIDYSQMSKAQKIVFHDLHDLQKNHPILQTLGIHALYPTSERYADAVKDNYHLIEKALDDLLLLHIKPEFCKIFGVPTKKSSIPIYPWQESVDDIPRKRITAHAPTWGDSSLYCDEDIEVNLDDANKILNENFKENYFAAHHFETEKLKIINNPYHILQKQKIKEDDESLLQYLKMK